MAISLHYCCGKLKNIEWMPVKQPGCDGKHKMGDKPCCESKLIFNKQKPDYDNFLLSVKSGDIHPAAFLPTTTYLVQRPVEKAISPVAFAPPPLPSNDLFLLHCVFRI